MNKLNLLLSEYGESHQNKLNKTIHWFCVPLIFWSIVALLYSIPIPQFFNSFSNDFFHLNWAMVALIFVMIYYVALSKALSFGMLFFALLCLATVQILDGLLIKYQILEILYVGLIVFAISWVFQFYGHKIEGKKPSFLKDIQFLLIGPLWLLSFVYSRFKIPY